MITQKRVSNLSNYLIGLSDGEEFIIGVRVEDIEPEVLEKIGFTQEMTTGTEILPAVVGMRSKYNANGDFIKHKDKPKEWCCRIGYIKDWHGHEHMVDISYPRYQRTNIPAPNVHLTISEAGNARYIVSPILINSDGNKEANKHIINLFLELFAHCEVYAKDLSPVLLDIPIKRINWHILPEGDKVWDRVGGYIGNITHLANKKQRILSERAKLICEFGPDNIYVGNGGFAGYLIYEFRRKNFFVVDSIMYGQATYILGDDWETISKLSKSDIVQNDLHQDRIIHTRSWVEYMRKALE